MAQDNNNQFFIGRLYDLEKGQPTDKPLYYDPANLTTHAIVTGMTGSGKTGFCVSLLEEAALQRIPAIIIDPKGDLTNLVLHFPDLAPKDFEPWLDAETARRDGKSLPDLAAETAKRWQDGLAGYGLGREQLLALKSAVNFKIFTPGSTAGYPVNILSSFNAPDEPWEENSEVLRETISSTVTALLVLVGMKDIDPLRSREHILISNLIETAWSHGKSLDLAELIMQVQTPPFERLGAFPLDKFFPDKDRMDLALMLNNFLASPSFQAWSQGAPLDIPTLLFSPEGKPNHSIFYLAHLDENERMFFVTLLYAAVEAWMRTQSGTGSLRALVYFDEIMGYLPAVSNPPSRPIMLRMLKQARAFGVGLLLATQNPVDVDYKALSNAGTWIIGRLQTEQDKNRLMDGLRSAGGTMDVNAISKIISGLGKRTFLLHSVHLSHPQIFQTRWALNYLAGPLTRKQIPALNQLAGATDVPVAVTKTPETASQTVAAEPVSQRTINGNQAAAAGSLSTTRPAVPAGLTEFFIPASLSTGEALTAAKLSGGTGARPEGLVYRPGLFAQAEIHYLARNYNVNFSRQVAVMIDDLKGSLIKWEQHDWPVYDTSRLQNEPLPNASFAFLPGWLSDVRQVNNLKRDFSDWVFREGSVQINANESLKVYAGPDVSPAEFREMCSLAARSQIEAEQSKAEAAFKKSIASMQQKLTRQQGEVAQQKKEADQRTMEMIGSGGELLLSFLGGRKKSISSSLSKHRLAEQAKAELEQEMKELEQLELQFRQLSEDKEKTLKEISDRWAEAVATVSKIPLAPQKKDVFLQVFGVAWLPYYVFMIGNEKREVPAYS